MMTIYWVPNKRPILNIHASQASISNPPVFEMGSLLPLCFWEDRWNSIFHTVNEQYIPESNLDGVSLYP